MLLKHSLTLRAVCAVSALGALLTAYAELPALTSPVLPEVRRDLADGRKDLAANTFPMARAHALMVLLGPEVKLRVLFQNVPAASQAACLAVLDSATSQWENVLGGDLKFVRCAATDKSDVIVRFRPSVTMRGEQVAGFVNWKRAIDDSSKPSIHATFSADLQIRVKDLDGHPMPRAAMRHAVLHELGHVLGLDDSPRQGDVMGPLDISSPVATPTQLEVDTVRALRSEAQEILNEASR